MFVHYIKQSISVEGQNLKPFYLKITPPNWIHLNKLESKIDEYTSK